MVADMERHIRQLAWMIADGFEAYWEMPAGVARLGFLGALMETAVVYHRLVAWQPVPDTPPEVAEMSEIMRALEVAAMSPIEKLLGEIADAADGTPEMEALMNQLRALNPELATTVARLQAELGSPEPAPAKGKGKKAPAKKGKGETWESIKQQRATYGDGIGMLDPKQAVALRRARVALDHGISFLRYPEESLSDEGRPVHYIDIARGLAAGLPLKLACDYAGGVGYDSARRIMDLARRDPLQLSENDRKLGRMLLATRAAERRERYLSLTPAQLTATLNAPARVADYRQRNAPATPPATGCQCQCGNGGSGNGNGNHRVDGDVLQYAVAQPAGAAPAPATPELATPAPATPVN